MPTNILNLPQYTVTALKEDEHDFHVSADVAQQPLNCPHCQSRDIRGFGRREQLIKDMPADLYRVITRGR